MKLNEVYHLINLLSNCIRRDQNSTYKHNDNAEVFFNILLIVMTTTDGAHETKSQARDISGTGKLSLNIFKDFTSNSKIVLVRLYVYVCHDYFWLPIGIFLHIKNMDNETIKQ
jgi:hypothetical protein